MARGEHLRPTEQMRYEKRRCAEFMRNDAALMRSLCHALRRQWSDTISISEEASHYSVRARMAFEHATSIDPVRMPSEHLSTVCRALLSWSMWQCLSLLAPHVVLSASRSSTLQNCNQSRLCAPSVVHHPCKARVLESRCGKSM